MDDILVDYRLQYYVPYTPNLGSEIALLRQETEQRRFVEGKHRGSSEGALRRSKQAKEGRGRSTRGEMEAR